MRRIFLIVILCIALSLSACKSGGTEETNVPDDRVELVYAVPSVYMISDSALLSINNYLKQQGKPYKIKFLPIEIEDFGFHTDYAEKLNGLLQSEQSPDISSCWGSVS